MKKWQILSEFKVQSLKFKVDAIIKLLLENRGLKTKKETEEFLNSPDPQSLKAEALNIDKKELDKATKRIIKAVKNHESIVVYGDYDADGVCATAILWETLNSMGVKVMPYIPHRVEEGYGLSEKGIDNVLHEFDAKLIITVDHGITAWEKVEYGKKLGIDFIISDHHVKPEKLPKALAIIHTIQLCGAGVAWILAQELKKKCHPEALAEGSHGILRFAQNDDLAAIATIADLVPLTAANRVLVKDGLKELNQTKRPGLRALIREANLEDKEIGVYDVSHLLAPRLNAMGRLEHAMDSLRLVCTKDENRAQELAKLLNDTNRERQDLTQDNLLHAKTLANKSTSKLIFIVDDSYNQGVIGLVAGKLVEEFYRPAIVVAKGEEFSKGSCRSIAGFNIIETLRKASDFLVDCGGHPMAAGFTVATKNLEKLQKKLEEIAEKELDEKILTRVLKIDCELELGDLTMELNNEIQKLMPFGLGNPEPVFCSRGVLIKDARIVGRDGKHLKLKACHPERLNRHPEQSNRHPERSEGSLANASEIPAVAFGLADLLPKLNSGQPVDIAYTLTVNEWNNEKKLELKIRDIKID